ncbi:MAG: AMP-binding protein [Gemmatimonas sp.]|nr:AMP-binding protein [Gemmatimonas sp.]
MERSPPGLVDRALKCRERTALIDVAGAYTYADLVRGSQAAAARLLEGAADLAEARVAFLVEPGFDYVVAQWGIWLAGGVAVPLAVSHPPPELAYTITDSDASMVIASATLIDRVRSICDAAGLPCLTTDELGEDGPKNAALPELAAERRAMILYTSGTTSRPKGVVSTHANIRAQVETLVDAWEWGPNDHVLLVLPLHHVHGIINVLTCALWSGARCTMHRGFEAEAVWTVLAEDDLTLFMAVPTVYSKLIGCWEAAPAERREDLSNGCRRLRLMVSGSAALPVTVLDRWRSISGHTLLERYGMTEIGMALSNPLRGERRPGHVGAPLPGVEVRLVDELGDPVPEGSPGEIRIRGASVFSEYWRRPEATGEAFVDGWFRTGDVAQVSDGYYRILGRSSVDILKSGGYKISALEIEEVLRTHPEVTECAVVGVEDEEWGERVSAALVLRAGASLSEGELRQWASERLASYKVPRDVFFTAELPRNAMGKVTKLEVKKLFAAPF